MKSSHLHQNYGDYDNPKGTIDSSQVFFNS